MSVDRVQPIAEFDYTTKLPTKNTTVRVAESGSVTYVGIAQIGSATNAAVWQIKKIDETSGTVVTWADGNANTDNVWDNRASLTYA